MKPQTKTYTIGTRASALALNQANWVKSILESRTSDKFELYTIETEGDQKLDQALWQLEGKDFFTKELDRALNDKKIDLVVHSYKDLGTIRPKGFTLAAITKRAQAQDILIVYRPAWNQHLGNPSQPFIVGTSSPRRIKNLEKNLSAFLPHNEGQRLTIGTKILRGNVFTRIKKLLEGQYHGIVLALAGLERLSQNSSDANSLAPLLENCNFMILPQSHFPSAAAQGALAIEILSDELREDQGELRNKLQCLHHDQTFEEVKREREAFLSYGGGCHLAVGIHVSRWNNFFLHRHQGEHQGHWISKQFLEGRNLPSFFAPISKSQVFIGLCPSKLDSEIMGDELIGKIRSDRLPSLPHEATTHYLTTMHAHLNNSTYRGHLFVAGTSTWKALAKKGIWAHGTSDGLGDELIKKIWGNSLMALLRKTHHIDEKVWRYTRGENQPNQFEPLTKSAFGIELPCYQHQLAQNQTEIGDKFKQIKIAYWSSYEQFKIYQKIIPSQIFQNLIHTCGLGDTFRKISSLNQQILPFISLDEFYEWLNFNKENT